MQLSGPGLDAFPTLFSPGRLIGLEVPNRTVVSPMTRTSATPEGMATAEMAEYYAAYARGGWGVIISEGTYIDEAHSQGYWNQPGIATDAQQDAWRQVVEAVHAEGGRIVMQLMHAGALSQGNRFVEDSIAPSPIRPKGEQAARYNGSGPFRTPREITRDEMAAVVASFAAAGRRAAEIGFDGVEVHGANGYLLDQFLTSYTNAREDEYGGPVENRMRFHVEVMSALRKAVDPTVPVGVRISQTKTNDHNHVWEGGDDDARAVFGALGRIGNLFVDVSAHLGCAPVFGTDRSLAGLAKRHSGLTVMANGKLHDPAEAERALREDQVDFCAIAKGALADPDWPRKVAAGHEPVPFDPDMISPLATLSNTAGWRRAQAAQ